MVDCRAAADLAKVEDFILPLNSNAGSRCWVGGLIASLDTEG